MSLATVAAPRLLFALDQPNSESALSVQLAQALGMALAPLEMRDFADGEFKVRPLVDPYGVQAWILANLAGDERLRPGERVLRLACLAAALRQHGAVQVNIVLPYLAFARKDRITQPFDPLSGRVVAQLLEAVGITQVLALEVHNLAAYQNAFRIPVWHVPVFAAFDAVLPEGGADPWVVVAPDPGGIKRAQLWREHLMRRFARPIGFVAVDKERRSDVLSALQSTVPGLSQATVLILDDLVVTGQTLQRAAELARSSGAARIWAFAAHALLREPASLAVGRSTLDALWVTDSVPLSDAWRKGPLADTLRVVSAAPVLAQAMQRLQQI